MKYDIKTIKGIYDMFSDEGFGDAVMEDFNRRVSMDFDFKRLPLLNSNCVDKTTRIYNVGTKRTEKVLEKDDGKERHIDVIKVDFIEIKDFVDKPSIEQFSYPSHLYFETQPMNDIHQYDRYKNGWKQYVKENLKNNELSKCVLKKKEVLKSFFDYVQMGNIRTKTNRLNRSKQYSTDVSVKQQYIKHFLDCVINNHKGLDSKINGINSLEFLYFINVFLMTGFYTDNSRSIYDEKMKIGRNRQKHQIKLRSNYNVRKNDFKRGKLEKDILNITFDFNEDFYNCLRVLKSGDKKYERYLGKGFKDLKLDDFFTQKTH